MLYICFAPPLHFSLGSSDCVVILLLCSTDDEKERWRLKSLGDKSPVLGGMSEEMSDLEHSRADRLGEVISVDREYNEVSI